MPGAEQQVSSFCCLDPSGKKIPSLASGSWTPSTLLPRTSDAGSETRTETTSWTSSADRGGGSSRSRPPSTGRRPRTKGRRKRRRRTRGKWSGGILGGGEYFKVFQKLEFEIKIVAPISRVISPRELVIQKSNLIFHLSSKFKLKVLITISEVPCTKNIAFTPLPLLSLCLHLRPSAALQPTSLSPSRMQEPPPRPAVLRRRRRRRHGHPRAGGVPGLRRAAGADPHRVHAEGRARVARQSGGQPQPVVVSQRATVGRSRLRRRMSREGSKLEILRWFLKIFINNYCRWPRSRKASQSINIQYVVVNIFKGCNSGFTEKEKRTMS